MAVWQPCYNVVLKTDTCSSLTEKLIFNIRDIALLAVTRQTSKSAVLEQDTLFASRVLITVQGWYGGSTLIRDLGSSVILFHHPFCMRLPSHGPGGLLEIRPPHVHIPASRIR